MALKERLKKLNKRPFSPWPAAKVLEKLLRKRYSQSPYLPAISIIGPRRRRSQTLCTGYSRLGKQGLTILVQHKYLLRGVRNNLFCGHWFCAWTPRDREQTWTHENGTFWPKDLLPHALPGGRLFSCGYSLQIMATKSVAGMRDFAKHDG